MYTTFIKRVFDLLASIILLPFLLLLLVVLVPIVYFDNKGPFFYRSKRNGKNMKEFTMWKIRTMKVNAPDLRNDDGSTYNSSNDPRITNVGRFLRKTSIDEIPQIFNVIMGEMSFIGPRPELASQKELYLKLGKDTTKFKVKPGITGYAQVNGRNAISWDQKLEYDHYYVDHCSFFLDIKILFLTIIHVLKTENINKK